jgi:hypothetical protein
VEVFIPDNEFGVDSKGLFADSNDALRVGGLKDTLRVAGVKVSDTLNDLGDASNILVISGQNDDNLTSAVSDLITAGCLRDAH